MRYVQVYRGAGGSTLRVERVGSGSVRRWEMIVDGQKDCRLEIIIVQRNSVGLGIDASERGLVLDD